MLWSLHPHQLGWRPLCCCDKQLCSLSVERVLKQLPPPILSAHCLEENICGQHPDAVPCCAALHRVSQLPYCAEGNRELGHNHFLSSLHCAVVYQSFCVLLPQNVCFRQEKHFPVSCLLLTPANTWWWGSHLGNIMRAGQWGGLVASIRERWGIGKHEAERNYRALWAFVAGCLLAVKEVN